LAHRDREIVILFAVSYRFEQVVVIVVYFAFGGEARFHDLWRFYFADSCTTTSSLHRIT